VLEGRAVPAVLNVTTTLDLINPNDSVLSLREAVIQANASNGATQIVLPAGTYELTLVGANEDAAATGDLDITDHLTISGAAADSTIIQGSNGDDRVFQVIGAKQVSISGVTIQSGIAGDGFGSTGGGILVNDSDLTIDHCIIRGNAAFAAGGGVAISGGTLTVIDCTLSENFANFGGGGIYASFATVTIKDSVVSGNSALSGGGVFLTNGTLTVHQSTISGNSALWGTGGGVFAFESTLTVDGSTIDGNVAAYGGGIYAEVCTLKMKDSSISGNLGGGGGLWAYLSSADIKRSMLNDNDSFGIVNGFSSIHVMQTVVDGVFYKNQDYP
jgi:predicted outer membrane repeat protein